MNKNEKYLPTTKNGLVRLKRVAHSIGLKWVNRRPCTYLIPTQTKTWNFPSFPTDSMAWLILSNKLQNKVPTWFPRNQKSGIFHLFLLTLWLGWSCQINYRIRRYLPDSNANKNLEFSIFSYWLCGLVDLVK